MAQQSLKKLGRALRVGLGILTGLYLPGFTFIEARAQYHMLYLELNEAG